jgi:hypothetical protein
MADITMAGSSSTDGNKETTAGLQLRRQANGDCLMAALDYTADGRKWVRVYKNVGGELTVLKSAQLPSTTSVTKSHNLSVFLYEENIRVFVDFTRRIEMTDPTFSSGGVGLASFGAKHLFDNVRIYNESPYGEQDILDCIDQFLEEISVDPNVRPDCSRIYVSGLCVGGLGAWNLGLHYPDLFSFLHPTSGATDLAHNYSWITANYPDQDGVTFRVEQDYNIPAALRNIVCGREPDSTDDLQVRSNMHENSARYILENALNTPVRIEHPEYDSMIPNTTNPMTIKYKTPTGGVVKVKDGDQRPCSNFAHSQGLWQTWANTPGLYNCVPETSLYNPSTGVPYSVTSRLGIWNNYDYSVLSGYLWGAHVVTTMWQTGVIDDFMSPNKVFGSFKRLNALYGQLHTDPNDVAYRTYDNKHNGSWWLKMEIAYPDQDQPGLARIHRDIAGNSVNVHVKNVKTTTLDVKRMKLDTSGAVPLAITVDANTLPESEFKITDTWRKTDLKLAGEWYPAQKASYQVTLDGNPVAFEMTGGTLTIPSIDTTATRNIAITVPSGLENMLSAANPGFEAGATGWSQGGAIDGLFELNKEAYYSHTGTNSIRIKDPKATASPYEGSWQSSAVAVNEGQAYTLSAFAKTRNLNSIARAYQNGKYSSISDSSAMVRILWLDAAGTVVGENTSEGIRNTTEWTPLEVTADAPAGATQAKAALLTRCPNNQGITGSAWFDDIALR